MDITGRVSGYRGSAVRCPGCADAMTTESLDAAEVDVCNGCGGIWIDWFDGEVRAVAKETLDKNLVGRPSDPDALRSEARAIGACPRCARQLVSERYRIASVVPSAGSPSGFANAVASTGAELLRCEECAGAFVSRESAALLTMLPPDEAPPSAAGAAPGVLEPLPWQRILAALRALLGLR